MNHKICCKSTSLIQKCVFDIWLQAKPSTISPYPHGLRTNNKIFKVPISRLCIENLLLRICPLYFQFYFFPMSMWRLRTPYECEQCCPIFPFSLSDVTINCSFNSSFISFFISFREEAVLSIYGSYLWGFSSLSPSYQTPYWYLNWFYSSIFGHMVAFHDYFLKTVQ